MSPEPIIILTTLALGLWLAWRHWALPTIATWIRIDWTGPLTESWPNPFAELGRALSQTWAHIRESLQAFTEAFTEGFTQER